MAENEYGILDDSYSVLGGKKKNLLANQIYNKVGKAIVKKSSGTINKICTIDSGALSLFVTASSIIKIK